MKPETLRALRRSPRLKLLLPARCRSRSGFLDRVVISDISEGGCRIDCLALVLRPGDPVVIRPDALEGLGGVSSRARATLPGSLSSVRSMPRWSNICIAPTCRP